MWPQLESEYYPHFTEEESRLKEVNSPTGTKSTQDESSAQKLKLPLYSLPSVRPATLSPSIRLVPILTSRDCPGSRWRLCVEHDLIVLRRNRWRVLGYP